MRGAAALPPLAALTDLTVKLEAVAVADRHRAGGGEEAGGGAAEGADRPVDRQHRRRHRGLFGAGEPSGATGQHKADGRTGKQGSAMGRAHAVPPRVA